MAPFAVAVPIVAAAVILVAGRRLARPAVDLIALVGALTVVVAVGRLLWQSAAGRVVTWSGGWTPTHGSSVGIVLVGDPVGAGIALLASVLMTLALVFSWRYVEVKDGHYHCLMMVFLAGMEGFALTGDLFDMFVFFEVMGAAAYALTGTKIEDPGSLQGGMNFGIVNSLAAYIALMGIGILYAKTGQLGLPQLGRALSHQPRSTLLVTAFVLLMAGFLVKGAVAPFHFWLADAHAVAPSPVCLLFSGVMVPLGVYGAFRVYWASFPTVIPPSDAGRAFLTLGIVTGVVGTVMCLQQRNIKRLLAYSTIAHAGLFVVALGLLSPGGVTGASVYVVAHAGVKGALFLMGGVLLARYGTVDEVELHGRGGDAGLLRWLFPLAALALACLPPFGTALGKAISEDAGSAGSHPWVPVLFVAVSACTGGAVLRVAGRVLFGLGPPPEEGGGRTSGDEVREGGPLHRMPATMAVPIMALLGGALAVGVLPGVSHGVGRAAALFVDGVGYRNQALYGAVAHVPPVGAAGWTRSGVLSGLLSAALAVGVAAAGIWSRSIIDRVPRMLDLGRPLLATLRALHSGHVGDYVAWLMLGLAVLGGLLSLPAR